MEHSYGNKTLCPQPCPPLTTLLVSPGHAHVPAVFLDQVFGCSLLALCERERGTVPHFVLQCIQTVERRGTTLGTGTASGTVMGRWGQLRGQPTWDVRVFLGNLVLAAVGTDTTVLVAVTMCHLAVVSSGDSKDMWGPRVPSRVPNVPSQGGLFNWEISPFSICPGLDIDGLYRVSGNLATIQKLRYKVEHGMVTHDDSEGQWGITPPSGTEEQGRVWGRGSQ